jgi:hypothetical protein
VPALAVEARLPAIGHFVFSVFSVRARSGVVMAGDLDRETGIGVNLSITLLVYLIYEFQDFDSFPCTLSPVFCIYSAYPALLG